MSGHRLIISPGVVLASVEQDEDSKSGFRTIYTFTGSESGIDSQRQLARQAGAKTINKRSKGDGNYELICTYPFDADDGGNGDAEVPTDTHELESSMAQQDVFLNPKLISGVSEANRQILKSVIDRYKGGKFNNWLEPKGTLFNEIIDSGGPTDDPQLNLCWDYFKLFALRGVEHFIFYRSVYSRTITSATPRQVQASFYGSQKLWTTAQLLAWENLPNDWWFQLPTDYVWHKSEPTVRTDVGRGRKTQITYRYIASNEASTLLYDNL